MDTITILAGILFVFLIGYILGKMAGYKKGFIEGIHIAPFKMRADMIHNGKCPICKHFSRMEEAN